MKPSPSLFPAVRDSPCAASSSQVSSASPWTYGQSGAFKRLEIFPAERTLHAPHKTQQLAVIAHFADGTKRDVTRLTVFESSDDEIATVDVKGVVSFSQTGDVAILCRYQMLQAVRLSYADPKPGFLWSKPREDSLIDTLIFAKLKQLSLTPSELCSDEVFLRRAYLDLCGILPTPQESRRFLESPRLDKRVRLIDELLERPEYAELWAYHWARTLNLKFAGVPRRGAAYIHWLRGHLHRNMPLDQMVREIIMGKEVVSDTGPASFYTDAEDSAEAAIRVSEAFLGIRMECAKCHPNVKAHWTPKDWHHYAAFFSQTYRKTVRVGPNAMAQKLVFEPEHEWLHPDTKKPVAPRFLDGVFPRLKPEEDRRKALAAWITAPKNPYFARTLVNHTWLHLMGRGLGNPPEALHEPWVVANDAVLDVLATELVGQRYDVKHLIRNIMTSRTYQLSSKKDKFGEDDVKFFSRGNARRLQGEVLIDVLAQFLEVPAEIESMPVGTRAVHVLQSAPQYHFFISRPQRITGCEANRERHIPHLLNPLNNDFLLKQLSVPKNRVDRLLAEKRTDREMLDDTFLAAFSRLPKEQDYKMVAEHLERTKDRRRGWEDVMWAVINTREFMFRP
ncbi:MAG: DUF1549 domain-containing protein [Gemmataceae bacterium]|nr:DUF1549 domain-containing protein [Gemmataceae bacterium]